jgi:hypothetical protein
VAHTFLEHACDPRQRQDHLDVGICFCGEPAELLHGALLVNLISFLHSDSPFSWKKNFPEAITPRGARVATFYDLPGIPLYDAFFRLTTADLEGVRASSSLMSVGICL